MREHNPVKRNRTLIVGPLFSGKTYLIFKKKGVINKDRSVITIFSEQYEEKYHITNEIGEIIDYGGGIVILDDMLDSNQKAIDPFIT